MSTKGGSPSPSEVSAQAVPTGSENTVRDLQGTKQQPESAVTDQFKLGPREVVILSTLAALNVILALDATVLVPALSTLAKELHGTSIEAFWTGSSYLLANAVFIPFLGSISDLFGRQAILLSSLIVFTIGSILTCTATGFPQLLAGRTVQGAGGSGLYVMSYVVVADIVPMRQRPKYQALLVAAWAFGSIPGPVIGGAIAEHTIWQWLFYINFPFCAIGIFTVPFTFRHLRLKDNLSLGDKLKRIDWIGSIVFMAGTSTFLIGLTWAGVQYDWSSFRSWLPILLGSLSIVASIVYEKYWASQPFMKVSLFRDVSACITFFLCICSGLQLYCHMYFLPFYMEAVKGIGAVLDGAYVAAVTFLIPVLGILSGRIITRLQSYIWVVRIGFALLVLSNGVLLLLNQHRSLVAHLFIILTISFGHGLGIVSISIAVQAMTPPPDMTQANIMYAFTRQLGMALGVSLGGSVFNNVLLKQLQVSGYTFASAQAISRNAEAFVATIETMPAGPAKTILIDSYVHGFHGVFYFLLALAALALVLSFFVKQHSLDKELDSTHRLAEKQSTSPNEA